MPTICGFQKYQRLFERVRFWEQFLDFLQYAETAIRYTAIPAEELLRYHAKETRFVLIRRSSHLCALGNAFPEAWQEAVKSVARDLPLRSEETSLLLRFGDGFGTTDTEGQRAHFAYYRERAEEKQQVAQEEKHRKGRLSLLLGVLAGLGLDVLFL